MLKNFMGKLGKNEDRPPQRHITDDMDEDDYVEVTGVNDEAEDGWEEVMVVKSPPLRTTATPAQPPIIPIIPHTQPTPTLTLTPTLTQQPVHIQQSPVVPIHSQVPPQDLTINNVNNSKVVQEIVEEVIAVVPSSSLPIPIAVPLATDPEWLVELKAKERVPYVASQQGGSYVASYVGEPYAHVTAGTPPYASPQDGVQYLASITSPVSYLTSTTVISKEEADENQPPYCVAY